MSDTLLDSEILGVWQRTRKDIDLSRITASDKMNQKQQLRQAMEAPVRKSPQMATLVENNFPSAFIENPDIRKELLRNKISEITVRGQKRFTIRKGVPSVKLSSGKSLRAGRFLRGKSMDEAVEDLDRRTEE